MQVVLAEPAERDLTSIIDYIALDNPPAALNVFRRIEAAMRRLADFPELADRVTVFAIFHTAPNLSKALEARKDELKP